MGLMNQKGSVTMNHPLLRSLAAATAAVVFGMIVAAGTSARADTVDELVAFSAGTTAKADEVNANFSEVANAVNGNDALIAELVTELAELRASLEAAGSLSGRVVSVANTGNAAADCDMLREALAGTDGVAANPVRIKLERGTYDCGSTPVMMKSFVTIEGAGRNLSTIIGSVEGFEQGLINGASDTELRNLSVENRLEGFGVAIAIRNSGQRMSVTDVAVRVDSALDAIGIFAPGGSLSLADVSVQVSAMQGGSGIRAESGAQLNMTSTRIHAQSANVGSPAALELADSTASGIGILMSGSRNVLRAVGNSRLELVDGTVIGLILLGADFSGSFSCIGVADGDFNPRTPECF